MLAGAQRVRAVVGAGAVRVPRLEPSQRHAVRLATQLVGDGVVGPGLFRVRGFDRHLLFAGTLRPLGDRSLDEVDFREAFHRLAFGWRRRQAQRHFLLEHQGKDRTHVIAGRLAVIAAIVQPLSGFRHQRERDDHRLFAETRGESHAKQIVAEMHVLLNVERPGIRATLNQLPALRAQQFAGVGEGKPRKTVLQSQSPAGKDPRARLRHVDASLLRGELLPAIRRHKPRCTVRLVLPARGCSAYQCSVNGPTVKTSRSRLPGGAKAARR